MTTMNEIVYYDRDGKRRKKPPRNIPPFIPKNVVDGEGVSLQNGFPTTVTINTEVKRKNAKSKRKD